MSTQKTYVSFDKLSKYHDLEVARTAAEASQALADAKTYAEGLGTNYDPSGSAASALAEAKAYADGKDAAIAEAKKAGEDAAAAASVADGKAVTAQNEVDALEGVVETKAAQSDLEALAGKVGDIPEGSTVRGMIDEINENAYDDTELRGLVNGLGENKADKTQVATDIADAVKVETDARVEAVGAVQEALDTLTQTQADDKAELQENIDAVADAVELLTEGVDAEKVDGVKDLIAYVEEHGTEVTGMKDDIAGNTDAINGVAGRVDTLEGEMDEVQGAVATKAEAQELADAVANLQGADTGLGNRIATLEGKFGGAEGSVEDMIADAKAEAIEAAGTNADTKDEAVLEAAKKYADDEDALIEARVDALEEASETHATKGEVEAVDGKVTTLEGKVSTLETEMDAVEAKAKANEDAIAGLTTAVGTKAAQTDLDNAVTRISNLESSVTAFVECTDAEINGLFQ